MREDLLLKENFAKDCKAVELAKLHGRSGGAIRSRLIKLGVVEKDLAGKDFENEKA